MDEINGLVYGWMDVAVCEFLLGINKVSINLSLSLDATRQVASAA